MTRTSSLIRPRTAIVAAIAVAGILVVAGLAALATRAPAGTPPVVTGAVHHDTSIPLAMIPNSATPPRAKGLVCKPIDEAGGEDPGAEQPAGEGGECPAGMAPTVENEDNSAEAKREANFPKPRTSATAVDRVVQAPTGKAPTMLAPATATSWDGLGDGFVGPDGTMAIQYAPPDTSLDVGSTQVVEVVNSELAVFSKTGTVLLGPVFTNTLWGGFGGLCESTNDGDATVQWDRLANRWVISQFAVSLANGTSLPYLQCVAVSATADATGSWYRYSFPYAFFNDYPKLAVWPDGYYTTFNDFDAVTSVFSGATTCAYNRSAMLTGAAATQQCFTTSTLYGGVLVAGVEGATAPAAGTAAYAIAQDTSTAMALWRFHVDWATPANSTWTMQSAPAVSSWAAPCNNTGGTCIPQTGTTQKLDTLGDRAMYRFVYRNVGGTDTFALSWSVNSGNSTSNIRWARFTPSGSTLTTADQGTYAPDTASRWMPSIAIDHVGNLALVYSTSSSSTAPSIRYAGRLTTDPAGTLGQAEATLITGGGSQTAGLSRWGDYAGIGVDPVDDCTFWMATEYIPANGTFNWKTQIASFKYPSCASTAPIATITPPATPSNAATLSYTVGFDKSVTGLGAVDLSVTGTATGCVVGAPSGSGASYTVALTGCTEGTVILSLAANAVTDASLNTGPASITTASTVTVDRTAPTVSSFSSAVSTPTNSTSIAYTLTFGETVTGLAAGDFTNAGTATGCTMTPSPTSGASITVTVTTCSTTGTLQPQLAANGVTDLATNTGPALASTATVTLTLDRVLPTVSAFTSAVGSPTNATSIAYSLTFSENVAGIAAGDFTNAGTATGCTFSPSAATATGGTPITVTITNCGTSGTLQPRLAANGVTDSAGNTGPASASAATITLTLDRVAPSVSAFTSAVATPTNSTSIVYSLTFAESVTGIAAGDFANAGTATGCTFTPSAATATGGTPITVTVTTCSTTGTLQPRLAIGSVTDAVGNTGPAAAATATTTLTLDGVAPTVASITPAASATNAASTTFTVTFSESVTGVAVGNFSLTASGSVSGASVSGVIGSGATRTVTVSTGSGDGTIRLDLSSASPSIADAAGNALSATFSGGTAVTVDKTAPSVTSFASLVSTPTNSTSIAYTLTLSESVTGIVAGDFSNAGTATGCTFTPTGSGASYTVTATTCSTTGTLQPQLAANGVTDTAGNTGPVLASAAATTLTLDRVLPTVSAFTSAVATPTNSTSIAYTLTLSESVTGIVAGDFANAGTATGCTFTPSGSGASYTVTVTTCSTTGTLQPQLAAGGVTDPAGNTGPASASAATTTLTLDRVAPTVSSIVPSASLTNGASATFTVTFSESVTGVAAGNFSLTTTGAVSGASVSGVTGSGATRTVTVSTGTGSGTIRLDLSSATPAIPDAAANSLAATFSAGTAVTVDKTAPTVSAFTSAVATPTNSTSIAYTLTLSESVTGIVAGDFTNAGTATGCTFTPSGSGASYTVTATTCSTTGTLQPQLVAGGVTDPAGNTGPASAASATTTLTLDRVAPAVSSIVPSVTLTNAASATFTVTFSESVTGVAAGNFSLTASGSVSGASVLGVTGSGAARTVTVSTGSGDGTIRLDLSSASPAISDAAANSLAATFSAGTAVTVDMTAPSVAVVPNATLTNAATIDYSVTFSESVTGLQIGDFGRTGTATGCVIGAPSGSGSSYTVLMTGCSDGTVTLSLNANTVTDAAANTGPTVTQTADTVTRDASPPTTVINAPTTPTNAATLTYDVVFNESVTGLTAADLARTGTATGCVVGSPAGAGAAWTVDVTGCSEGTVVLALNTGTVTDAASNTGPLAIATATTVVRDTTAPTAVITAPATPTGSVTLSYDITFSKAVTGLEALDIVTGGGTATGCAADAPTGSGTAWTVTLSGCSVGTVTFGLLGNAVTDQAGNTGPATQVDADMVTVIHDTTNPTFSQAIAVALRAGSSLATASTTSAIPVLITWAAADDAAGSGLDHYTLDRSTDGGITWLPVTLPALLTISYPTTMPTSGTVRYKVTAYDVMGNFLASQTASLSPRIIQQSSSLVKYSGIWYAYKAASLSGTTLKWSRTASAYATYTFTGRGIGFVAIKGIGRGYVKVYLDGKYKGQVSLYKTGAGVGRLLAWQSGTLTLGKHTIKLIVAGTVGHPRVDLDAFIVMK